MPPRYTKAHLRPIKLGRRGNTQSLERVIIIIIIIMADMFLFEWCGTCVYAGLEMLTIIDIMRQNCEVMIIIHLIQEGNLMT